MDDLFEFIFEFLFELGGEISKDKKVSKWIRYPLIALITLIFLGVSGLLLVIGIGAIINGELIGLLFLALGLFFLIGGVLKFRKEYLEKK